MKHVAKSRRDVFVFADTDDQDPRSGPSEIDVN